MGALEKRRVHPRAFAKSVCKSNAFLLGTRGPHRERLKMKTATLYIGVFVALCVCVLLHSHADLSVDVSNKLSSPVTPLPMSARSVDVLKSELVFTQTPQGAARLLDYLKSLERNLLLEKKRRKVVMAKLSNRLERN